MNSNADQKALVVFQDKKIRRVWYHNEWYSSVVDSVEALTDSPAPRQYWGVLKGREYQLLTFCLQLKLPSADDKLYTTDCANTQSLFRIIQSIPSPKAEPFKQWLARAAFKKGLRKARQKKPKNRLKNSNRRTLFRRHGKLFKLLPVVLGV